jgi:lipid A 3-O-deacylase
MMKYIITLFVFIILGTNGFAQRDSSRISTNKFIRFNYENDFFTQADQYYTQGLKLEAVSPAFRYSPIMWLLPRLSHSDVQYGLSAVQDCFTPTSIRSASILRGDRPFAGYVYLGHYKTSADYYKKQLMTAELDVGEIGACAECAEEQKAIHDAVPGNVPPKGWQFQIATGIMVNYKLRYEKALYADTAVDVDAIGQLNAGTVYDNALAGIAFHFGKMRSYFLTDRTSAFQLYGVVQGWVEGVGYNGTMQGDMFTNNSIYTLTRKEISPLVYGDSYGICLSWNKTSFTYSVTHISQEMISGSYHGWGHIDITHYF